MKYKNGEEFLNSLYNNMHMEDVVMHTAEKSDSPTEKISKYLERLERTHDIAKDNPHKMEVLKKFYYDKYVIKELPESYINLQKKIARERGYGDITVTDEIKKEMLSNVQKEQEKSLDMWIDYLTSDDAMYPMWFKHYAFRGMLKLNKFDKEKGEFGRRSKTTTEPYIELNREALARVYDTLAKEIGTNEEISEEAREALENGESFKKLYEYYLINTGYVNRSEDTDGIWIKYDQGSNYKPLWESLQGKNTGWCTAGEMTAKTQLSKGDFYVYYTKDNDGEYKEPRIAIRMDGKNKIGEVRGVGKYQNLEGCMTSIAEEKLNEFPDRYVYLKRTNDMKQLTEIEKKVNNNIILTEEEVNFLYEVDSKIDGFGYSEDPRIDEIKNNRKIVWNLSKVFNCEEYNIGTSIYDLNSNNDIIYFFGDLTYEEIIASYDYAKKNILDKLKKIEIIYGNVNFKGGTNSEVFENLRDVMGDFYIDDFITSDGLEKLNDVKGSIYSKHLLDATGFRNLKNVGGNLYCDILEYSKGFESLENIGGSLVCPHLIFADGFRNLHNIGSLVYCPNLRNAEGFENLETINGEDASKFKEEINSRGNKTL